MIHQKNLILDKIFEKFGHLIFIKIYFLLAFIICNINLSVAQNDLEINIEIAEPYPVELEYYLENESNLYITVANMSAQDRNVFYHVRLVSNNGIDARTMPSFKPVAPVNIPAFRTLFYTGNDLSTDFPFSYPEDVDLTAVTAEQQDFITFNRALPEGSYRLCVIAYDFNTNQVVGSGCSDEFNVSYGDMPFIYMPYQDEVIPTSQNNHVTIGWEPPYSLQPPTGTFSYNLKIIDITDDAFGDLELMMNNPGVYPVLDVSDITQQIYNYDFPPEIELLEGHQYAIRVQAIDNVGSYPIANNGYSEISTFWYGYNADEELEDTNNNQSQATDCVTNCNYTIEIGETPISNASNLDELLIGHFSISELNFINSSGSNASGTGTVEIPFLNDVKVNVRFDNIGINVSGRVFRGEVKAVVDKAYDPLSMTTTIAEEMNNFIRNGRIVSSLITGNGSIGMPLGLVQNISGHNFMFGFTKMVFEPNGANCQIIQNLHIPQLGSDGWISMGISEACLIPAGIGGEFILHPVNDYNIPYQGDITMVIKGSSSSNPETIKSSSTFMEIDCNGIKSFGLTGDVFFPESTLVKENVDGEILSGKVKGNFSFILERDVAPNENIYASYGNDGIPEEDGLHFVTKVDINPFQFVGLQGWGFEVANAWIDVSDYENPAGIQWPESYDDANITIRPNGNAVMEPTWTGVYVEEVSIKTPKEFLGTRNRESITANHMIIDPLVSMSIAAKDIISITDGKVDDWSISLDSLFITIVQNRLESGGFSGVLGLPITKENTYLRYTALIEDSDTENARLDPPSYVFSVRPEDEIEFPCLIAKAALSTNSYVLGKFTPNDRDETYFEAYLEGGLGISSELFTPEGNSSNIPLHIPIADFQFYYHSQDGFENPHFGFAGLSSTGGSEGNSSNTTNYNLSWGNQFSEESFAGFPINIENVELSAPIINDVKFTITPRVTLAGDQGGIAGAVGIDINSTLKTKNREKKMVLQGLGVSSLEVITEVYGLTLEGNVEFYNDQGAGQVGSKGARGGLQVMLPMGLGVKLAAEFGTKVTNASAAFGTASNYNYWYLDGMAYFAPLGIPIAPGVGIYGVGGGVFVNMTKGGSSAMSQTDVNAMLSSVNTQKSSNGENNSVVGTGSLPTPSFGSYGLKMATTLGTYPTETALNMDVSIYGEFSKNTGLSMIEITGDAFMFTPLSQRNKSNFWASSTLTWIKQSSTKHSFDGTIRVFVNTPTIHGNPSNSNQMVMAAFHAEAGGDGEWYFHAGSPDDRGVLYFDFPLLPESRASAYLMTGHGLPSDLPIPEAIAFMMNDEKTGDDKNKLTDRQPIKKNGESRSDYDVVMANNASGVAFGVELSVGLGFDAKLIYATLTSTLGFDINITQDPERTCYISGQGDVAPGIDGWYARGQVYAGVEGDVGIAFKFAGKEYNVSLFNMAAAMMLSGGGPNPEWAEGRAGITYSLLNGLVDGTKTFDLTLGQRCVPAFSDPFSGMEIIYETSPAEGETGVSIFTDPVVTFILPIGEEFTLPVMKEDGSTKDMTVLLELDKLNLVKEGGTAVNEKAETWDDDKQIVTLELDDVLSQFSDYEATVRIIGYEVKSSGNVRLKDENNSDWKEEQKWSFKTGRTPYPIPDDEIVKTIPIRRQRYYMQDQNTFKAGIIEFSKNMKDDDPSVGYFPDDNDAWEYTYYIRWQGLDGSLAEIKELTTIKQRSEIDEILSSVPTLLPATIYSCQLVRKKSRKGLLNNLQNTLFSGKDIISFASNDLLNEVGSTTNVNIEIPPLPGNVKEEGEEIIYQYYFRTSKYNTMSDKMASATITPIYYGSNASEYADLQVFAEEDFDVFDILGEIDGGGNKVTEPLVSIFSEEEGENNFVQNTQQSGINQGAAGGMHTGTGTSATASGHFSNNGMSGFFSYLKDEYNSFETKTKRIFNESHSVRYSHNFSYITGGPSNVTVTKNNLSESQWDENDLYFDYDSDKITYHLNAEVTGYRQPIRDDEIENAWEDANSNAFIPGTLGDNLNIVQSLQAGQSVQTEQFNFNQSQSENAVPKVTIKYDINDIADIDALNLWRWANDIDIKNISVNYSFDTKPAGSVIIPYSLTISENKWHDYLDDEIPTFHTAMDKVSPGNRAGYWLNNHYGLYKITFQGNDATGGGFTTGQKKKLSFRLE